MTALDFHDPVVVDPEPGEYLDDYLDGDINPTQPPTGADDANRYGRHHNRLTHQTAEINELADAEIARIEAWRTAQLDRLGSRLDEIEWALHQWHRAVLADDPTRKTIVLPSITIRSRAAQPDWQWGDETVFVAWAGDHAPTLIHVPEPRPRPAKAEAKKRLIVPDGDPGETVPVIHPDTGETVPGVTAVIRDRTYTITPTEDTP